MLEFSEKVVGKVMVSIEITEEDVEGIIVSSFEGGSNYWMGLDNSTKEWEDKPKGEPLATWATKLLLEGKSIKLYELEDSGAKFDGILTLNKILKGIELNNKNRKWAADKDNWDAEDADCIIQFALFGEVIYG